MSDENRLSSEDNPLTPILEKRPILKKIFNTSKPLQENVIKLIEQKKLYETKLIGIIDSAKNDLARLAGVALNSTISIPLDLVKLECIQTVLDNIKTKLDEMPVEDLYKVYTSSSPAAIAVDRVKTKVDDAMNNYLKDQCEENIPKLTGVIDEAYATAREASAAIDRLAGEDDTQKIPKQLPFKVSRETATQHAEDRKKKMVGKLDTQKQKISKILQNRKSAAGQTLKNIKQHINTGRDDYRRSKLASRGGAKSYMRKPHRRRTWHYKTHRRRTRHHKIHRNKKKTRSRTTRRKNKYKRKTR